MSVNLTEKTDKREELADIADKLTNANIDIPLFIQAFDVYISESAEVV